MTVRRQVFFLVATWLLAGFLTSCGFSKGPDEDGLVPVTVESAKKFNPASVNEIVVLPFESGLGVKSSDVDLKEVEGMLIRSVQLNTSLTLRNASDAESVRKTIAKYVPRKGTVREQAVYIGRDLGVQGVLYGMLSKYTELEGSKIGSETPAAVGCTLWLVDGQSGEVLWSARFADNERPLSENIFRIKRRLSAGVGNSTAGELLSAGFTEAFKRLEAERTKSTAAQ